MFGEPNEELVEFRDKFFESPHAIVDYCKAHNGTILAFANMVGYGVNRTYDIASYKSVPSVEKAKKMQQITGGELHWTWICDQEIYEEAKKAGKVPFLEKAREYDAKWIKILEERKKNRR